MPGRAQVKKHDCKTQRKFPEKGGMCVDCKCKGQPEHCVLYQYRPRCCPKDTDAHHVLPVRSFMPPGARRQPGGKRYEGSAGYDIDGGPCICVSHAKHKKMHSYYDGEEAKHSPTWDYADARDAAVQSVMDATEGKKPTCKEPCIKRQIDAAHKEMGIGEGTTLRANKSGPVPKNLLKTVPQSATVQGRP
jgi:hypothetical protein